MPSTAERAALGSRAVAERTAGGARHGSGEGTGSGSGRARRSGRRRLRAGEAAQGERRGSAGGREPDSPSRECRNWRLSQPLLAMHREKSLSSWWAWR